MVEIGALATFIGAVKVSQPHAWLFVLHYRWRAAAIGALAVAVLVALTLPLTGTTLWFDWIDQLRRAGNPAWAAGGFAMSRYLPALVAFVVAVACVVAVWFVPRRDGAPWVGILSTVGALSLHQFGLLFLIPGMLMIRLEIALVVACLIATHNSRGAWAAIILITVVYAASSNSHRSGSEPGYAIGRSFRRLRRRSSALRALGAARQLRLRQSHR